MTRTFDEVMNDVHKYDVYAKTVFSQTMDYQSEDEDYVDPLVERNPELYAEFVEVQTERAMALAEAGKMFLEKYYPDRLEEVDTTELDMASNYSCVIGQMFGSYSDYITHIWETHTDGSDDKRTFSQKHGFIDNGACYAALDLAWRKVLS